MKHALPPGDLKSYTGTLKAGSEPRPTSDTIEATTALRITVEVVFASDNDPSGGDGHKTDSTAKKQPATAALKPGQQRNKDNYVICYQLESYF